MILVNTPFLYIVEFLYLSPPRTIKSFEKANQVYTVQVSAAHMCIPRPQTQNHFQVQNMQELSSLLNLSECGQTFVLNTIRSPLVQPFAFDLLIRQLSTNRDVLLILLGENLQHYTTVLAKCGFNMKNCIEKGTIRIIDSFNYNVENSGFDYERLLVEVNYHLERLETKSTVVMIDSLNVLYSAGVAVNKIYSLIQCLRSTVHRCSLFVGGYYRAEDNDRWTALIGSLIYQCDVWLDCDQPKTGYSLSINGTCRVKYRNSPNKTTDYTFRISKRNVTLIPNTIR